MDTKTRDLGYILLKAFQIAIAEHQDVENSIIPIFESVAHQLLEMKVLDTGVDDKIMREELSRILKHPVLSSIMYFRVKGTNQKVKTINYTLKEIEVG